MYFGSSGKILSNSLRLADGAEYQGFPMFSIHPQDGLVMVAGKLDYETKSEYTLNISATDGENFAYCTVCLSIETC